MSKYITSVFKFVFNQVNYNKQYSYFLGVNCFWTILNYHPVIDPLNKLNGKGKATSISYFDFSTFEKVFNELIDFCFEGGNWEFVSVDGHGAKWAKERRSGVAVFAKSTLKKAVKYLLQNCFFKLGNRIFRQVIGIPMDPDPAPFFANLFLHYYETRWIVN